MPAMPAAIPSLASAPLPPLMPARHVLGHLPAMRRDVLGLFVKGHRDHGDIVRMRAGPMYIVGLAHPEHWHHVLVTARDNYAKDTRGYQMLRVILGDGLVTSEGEFWKRQRRIAQPAFHRKTIEGFAGTMSAAALDLAERWQDLARSGAQVDVAAEMMRLTLRIVGETLFSMDLTGESDDVGQAVSEMLSCFNVLVASPLPHPHRWPTPTAHRFRHSRNVLDRVVTDVIRERRASGEQRHDLLGILMSSEDEETGEQMTDIQLRDEVMTMILAGHETTANGLAWTLYLLSKHPDIGRQVAAELDRVIGADRPEISHLRDLEYTSQAMQESMRLYPPVAMIGRKAVADDVIGGFRIPAGSYVYMTQWAMHRHPELWQDPEVFDPSRFSSERIAARKAAGVHKFAYLPFSGGQRKCIGDHFAKMELQIILAVLLRRFELDLVPGHPVVPECSVTLRPKHGLLMTLRERTF